MIVEEIKRCNLFSHFTEEQALEVADTIKQFCLIVYEVYVKEKQAI
jgi:hypothetical protein